MSCCILSFPLFALLFEAFNPFVSFWIETFWVLVVSVLVILCWHAIQSWIEVFRSWVNRVCCLLERQGNTTTIEINVNNLNEYFVTRLYNGLWVLYVAVCQLRDVYETLDAIINRDECTELYNLGHLTLNNLSWNMGACETRPWILLSGLEGQGDALAIEINIEYFNGNLIANLHYFGWMVDMLP